MEGQARHVTSADVARAAGLSRGAVSQILNGNGDRFLPATRERVLATARTLGYEPSSAGRALARGRSDVVVAVIPHTTFGGNLQDILDVLTERLAEHGLLLVARFSTAELRSFDRFLASLRPVAVLGLGQLPAGLLGVLDRRGVELVGRAVFPEQEAEAQGVVGSLQAQHLHARGHRRLAYALLKDARDDVYGPGRLHGFQRACRGLGLPAPRVLEVRLDTVPDAQLGGSAGPLAVGCYNDDVALALLSGARRLGRTVPTELAVVGVDRTPLGQVHSPRLSTVGYDAAVVAEALARQVLATSGMASPADPPPEVEYEVVQGETT